MDNDGADGHSSDSYSKSFLPRFRALGDPCFFIGPFLLLWNRIVKSKNPSFRILDYFYFSTPGTIEYLLTLWLAGLLTSWKRTVLNVGHQYYIEFKSNFLPTDSLKNYILV